MTFFGRWHVDKPEFIARVCSSSQSGAPPKRIREALAEPSKMRLEIVAAFEKLKDLPEKKQENTFELLFAPGSYWSSMLDARRQLLIEVFGQEQYLKHPHKQELDTMALVLLARFSSARELNSTDHMSPPTPQQK